MASVVFVLTLLAVSASGLVHSPFTGCRGVSLLHRGSGNPANSKAIEGEDCGNVQQIVGKWDKSKQVGDLAGTAKAAMTGADLVSKNSDDAVSRSKDLGKKIGLNGKIPTGLALAIGAVEKASKALSTASSTLKQTTATFKGKFSNFAKDVTDDDIMKMKKETKAANAASDKAHEVVTRMLKKAADAKKASMNTGTGALNLITATLADASKLSKKIHGISESAGVKNKDLADLLKACKGANKKLNGKIKVAKEQAPVWKAYKADLNGRKRTANKSRKAFIKATKALDKAVRRMDGESSGLQGVLDKSQSEPNALLGQNKNIAAAEEGLRKTEQAFAALKMSVQTMMKDGARLKEKLEETEKRLK